MKNLYIYCEGLTEEGFINNVLTPYLLNIGVYSRPIVCATKRTKTKKFRGGISDYRKIRTELSILCKQHKNETITTMFDYYGFPTNAPGVGVEIRNLFDKITHIERAVEADINAQNLIFNLTVHEFEGLLFSDTSAFSTIANIEIVEHLQKMRAQFASPEHINDSTDSAPSKRVERLIPNYAKVRDGTIISTKIGVDVMLKECAHFQEWIYNIKRIAI